MNTRVRVSIANLAWYVRVLESSKWHTIAILNPNKLKKGERQYMALGGGAMLNEEGKKLLEEFGATDFEFDKETGFYDARFQIDSECIESTFKTFSNVGTKGATRYEQDPTLDFMAELTGKEFPGYSTILSIAEAKLVRPKFVRVVQQKPSDSGTDTSSRALAEVPTRRLFRIFGLELPGMLFEKLQYSPVVKFLSYEELMTTDGGCKAGRTKDGYPMQNNLFVP